MTADRYARLRECVEKATPGEWECRIAYESDDGPVDPHTYKAPGYYNNGGVYSPSANAWPVACDEYNIFETPDDWAYIAAASPATIRELLQERDRLREALTIAVAIIRKYVPSDALGTNSDGGGDGWNDRSWPILDEHLHYMDEALKMGAALSAGEEGR